MIQVQGKDADGNPIEQWTPCSPGDPAAVEKTWTDIGEKELQEPPLIVSFLFDRDTLKLRTDDILN